MQALLLIGKHLDQCEAARLSAAVEGAPASGAKSPWAVQWVPLQVALVEVLLGHWCYWSDPVTYGDMLLEVARLSRLGRDVVSKGQREGGGQGRQLRGGRAVNLVWGV